MEDPTTIALNLTFFGTLGVAFVMFIGLFLVFVATLVIAGLGRLVGVLVMAPFGRRPPSAAGVRTLRPLKAAAGQDTAYDGATGLAPEPEASADAPRRTPGLKTFLAKGPLLTKGRAKTERPPLGLPHREPHILSEDWAAAVAQADARAEARARAEVAPEVKVTVRDLPSPDAPVEEVRAVAPLVESATDQHAIVNAIPRAFEKPPGPGRMAMLETGSLVSLAGHPAALKGTLPVERRRAG
ncbi:hypothetical protein FCN77_24685 [Arthrobacter sp. 24S4-2]|uniref:hypothetical protein n=1 Tax=Arthrobacter sp. 24S4-2 TaxID=2575374 RepID=UPI0010C78FC8|nr:hypothetical protein [Arthrobacter sp. 24S4-2]QCP00315.1 hypothetical protein FCN77_24685 [Arthrobacter sp. 24S4-2]